MCGITGILTPFDAGLSSRLRAMNDAQAHRGPDGEGIWQATGVGLAHRRLAILDPSNGAQPMHSRSGDSVVVYNGTIYNFAEHRQSLEQRGHSFRTDTDTEVLLELYEREPDHPERWLPRLNGMFAFALWDRKRGRLLLARDPIGVKPLHLALRGEELLFASEIKSLLAGGCPARLNDLALHQFLNLRFVPGEHTLFDGIERLAPGHFLFASPGEWGSPRPYGLPKRELEDRGCMDAYREDTRTLFSRAVERQLLSDVPIGIALSGGLDSSMVVQAVSEAFASARPLRTADRELRTFTLGFNEPTDENEDAGLLSEHFGTTHFDTRLSPTPLSDLRTAIHFVEEPKVNMQQGLALAGFARAQVPVLLGGLGGDELFAGYDIHRFCKHLAPLQPLGRRLRPGLAPVSHLLWQLQARSGILKTEQYRIGAQIALSVGDKAQVYSRLRNAWDEDPGMYHRLYLQPERFQDLPRTARCFEGDFENDLPFLDQVLHCEFRNKLVNDFLVNEDRVTSAHGMEGRVPFLDHDLVDFALRIPARYKIRGNETKALWKASVADVLPDSILRKKKQGFSFSSTHQWDKDLRAAVERELTADWCHDQGLFNPAFIQSLLNYPSRPSLRWHYFVAWMMLGVKEWITRFDVQTR